MPLTLSVVPVSGPSNFKLRDMPKSLNFTFSVSSTRKFRAAKSLMKHMLYVLILDYTGEAELI